MINTAIKLILENNGTVMQMVEVEIELLKNKLNHLIGEGAGFEEVYELSVRLDKLIVQYYSVRNTDRVKSHQTDLNYI